MRQYHFGKGCASGQAKGRCRFELTLGHGFEGAQPNFAGERGEYQAESNHCGGEGIDRDFGLVAHGGQQFLRSDLAAVVDDQQGQ
ncbi:hypothetical protein D3C77_709650 [compost metagenome]